MLTSVSPETSIDHGGAPYHGSVIVDRQHGVGRRRVGELWRIRDDNRAESVAASGTDHIKKQHEPQPEKPLHSNSMEKVSVARKPILYREPGREGKSSGAKTGQGFKVSGFRVSRFQHFNVQGFKVSEFQG
jgi:hypothetical protein